MNKFQFSLDTVLDYKQQVLDTAAAEYGKAAADVIRQESVLRKAEYAYRAFVEEYRRKQMEGMTAAEGLAAQNALRVQEKEIQKETEILQKLVSKAEEKRLAMVEAKKESASIEKLREKKLVSYNKAVEKDQEKLIEEFVSTSRIIASGA